MNIPNGLTLFVENLRGNIHSLGNAVLEVGEKQYVHFDTIPSLKKALTLQAKYEVKIHTPIPSEVMELVNPPAGPPPVVHPDAPSGLFYRDEFLRFKAEVESLAANSTVANDLQAFSDVVVEEIGLLDEKKADKTEVAEVASELESTTALLAQTGEQKRDKSVPITSLDVSEELLTMFSPAGTVNPVVADRTINSNKTTFLKPKKNLFNKEARTIGYYTASSDGQLKNNITGYDSTDFMLVEGGQSYTLSHGGQWAEYDASKNFIVGNSSSVLTKTLNANTKYVRVSILQANVNTFQFEKGNTKTTYEPFTLVIKGSANEPIELIERSSIIPEMTNFMGEVSGKNMFDEDNPTIVNGQLPGTNTVSAGSGGISFLLPCEPNKTYTISRQITGTRFRAAFTDTSQLVTSVTPVYNYIVNDTGNSITLLPHPSAKFILCYFWREADQGSFTVSGLKSIDIQVEEGSSPTSYEPYQLSFKMKTDFLPPLGIDPIKINKKVSFLGDSITTFEGYIPEGNRARYPQSNLLTNVDETWWKIIIDETGMTLGVNESWAGSRVTWDGVEETEDRGANKHMASDARIGNLDNNGTPDVIFFFGGTNDASAGSVSIGEFNGNDLTSLNVSTFSEAYSTALIKMQTAYPNAKIVCLTPMYSTSNYTNEKLDLYCKQIEKICGFFGVLYVDLRKCGINIFNKGTHFGDGLHPNTSGMYLMSKYIMDIVINQLD